MLTLNIEVSGNTTGDLTLALDQVRKGVDAGYYSGADSNDTGDYNFKVTGEEEPESEEE